MDLDLFLIQNYIEFNLNKYTPVEVILKFTANIKVYCKE